MAKIRYQDWTPGADALTDIRRADTICREYARQGYDLTLRQLYYQFVARGWIPNNMKSYKRLGDIVNKARLAGLLDWDHIVDRTRNLQSNSHWTSPAAIMRSAARGFALDKWIDQPRRVEVWVEKEALAGVVQRVAERNDVSWFSCRGYVSQSELWGAAMRLQGYIETGQQVTILHLGDHDPSGLDMSRDIRDRLLMFLGREISEPEDEIEIDRIALNYNQVLSFNPPPNPAKLTDSRAAAYVDRYGYESWELDALDPATLDALIQDSLDEIVDPDLMGEQQADEDRHRELLEAAAARWDEIVELLEDTDG